MRFSLKTVLSGAIGLLALAAAGQGVASVVALSEIEGNAIAVSEQALPAQNQAEAIGTAVRDARLSLYRLAVASPDAAALDKNQTALTDTLGALSDLRQAYQEPPDGSPGPGDLRALHHGLERLSEHPAPSGRADDRGRSAGCPRAGAESRDGCAERRGGG